jgi:hypothetical protein
MQTQPLRMFGPDTPPCIDWSDLSAVDKHVGAIIEMCTIWCLHEKDIRGWMKLRDAAEASGDIMAMREFNMRARHSGSVCKVVMARVQFRARHHDPYPNTNIYSFSMPMSADSE